jgi:exopolysaccharide biosynthesis protein
MMLVIEGRQLGRSIGTDVETCAKILMRHDAYVAMNLDGGTSAIMYYDGEYVTKCSNTNISSRSLPNAWVYGNYE